MKAFRKFGEFISFSLSLSLSRAFSRFVIIPPSHGVFCLQCADYLCGCICFGSIGACNSREREGKKNANHMERDIELLVIVYLFILLMSVGYRFVNILVAVEYAKETIQQMN